MENSTINDTYKKQPSFMLNLSQAAQVSGYKDYRRIESFIKMGDLRSYMSPQIKRKKVDYNQFIDLSKHCAGI